MFGPIIYGLVNGAMRTMNQPDNHMQEFPTGDDPADPTLTPSETESAPDAENQSAESAGDALTSLPTLPEDTAPVNSFQVTHKVANPDNEDSHSLFTSAHMTADEAIAWIRDRLLHS